MGVRKSLVSQDGSIHIDIMDQIIMLCVDGPVAPDRVKTAIMMAAPYWDELNFQPWGTVIIVDKDATMFHEAIELMVDAFNFQQLHNRKALALVALPEIKDSGAMMLRMKELYGHKLKSRIPIEVFPSMAEAINWVRSKL